MSISSAFDKGASLEMAVHAIESAILRNLPSYNDKTFRIQSNKVHVVAGVRHEIDIWVTVDLGNAYESRFIFECKNWQDKVSKNEIIVFSEKIRATQAQRGFFVAKSFTSDADAQAELDPRVTLLRVADLPVADVPVPCDLHGVTVDPPSAHIAIMHPGADERGPRTEVDLANSRLVIQNEPLPMEPYFSDWISSERDKRVNSFPSGNVAEGIYDLSFQADRYFEHGIACLNDKEVIRMRLEGEVRVRVARPTIISFFEVSTRGRALTLALEMAGGEIKTTFVDLASPGSNCQQGRQSPSGQ